jgi:tRNA A-37 threonylcarbamoyl transferase component Bud32
VHPIKTTLPIGTLVQERYLVEALLDTGGSSAVYRVRDQRDQGKLFALKEVIHPSKQELERFAFECTVLSRLDHQALPHVFHVFDDDDQHRAYMLMNYVDGPNLETMRRQQPQQRFSASQTLTILAPIMDAVMYLHRQTPPILHRDIKPKNIIVPTTGGTTVLIDFGIAKAYEPEGTTTAVRHCSPGYSAPEQYSQGTGIRSDIYGLGATLYTLLTGRVPPDALHRIMQLSEGEPDPLVPAKQLVASVPLAVSEAIQRALFLNRNQRFSTVEEFWQALHAHPSEQQSAARVGVPAVPDNPVVVARRLAAYGARVPWRKQQPARRSRKPGILVLFLLGLTLLLGVGTGVAFFSSAGGDHASLAALPIAASRSKATPPLPTAIPHPTVTSSTGPPPLPTVTAPPSPAFPGYPNIAGSYEVSLYDIRARTIIKVSIVRVQQDQGDLSGDFSVDSGLDAHGLFRGTIDTAKHIRLTARDDAERVLLLLTGSVRSDGTILGSFCNLDERGQCTGQYGFWSIVLVSSGQVPLQS